MSAAGRARRARPAPASRRAGALAAAAVGLVAAACSSGPSAAPTTTTSVPGRSTTTSVPARSTTTSPSTTSTTAAGRAPTCQPSGLTFSTQFGSGAAGQLEELVVMENTSGVPCSLFGYPGLQLYDSSGAPIPTNVVRGGVTFGTAAANQPAALVTLSPGSSGAFTIHYSDVPVGNESSCPTSASAHITPPNDFSSASVALSIDPCGGGTVHVSPVYPS